MKENTESSYWGEQYYIHVNGTHVESFISLDVAIEYLTDLIVSDPNAESVTLETRDYWLNNIEE